MLKKSKNNKAAGQYLDPDLISDRLENIAPALRRALRRSLAAIDWSDEVEVLDVLRSLFCFTTMALAEEAYALGITDPLEHLEGEIGWLREGYTELKSRVVRPPDDDGAGGDGDTPF